MKEILCVSLILFFCSCQGDSNGTKITIAESLVGTWHVIEAKRNNRSALSLENSEFYITKDSFSTNFLPDTSKYPYSFDGNKINVMGIEKSTFGVTMKTTDTLIFKTVIKNFDFLFVAIPKVVSENETFK